MAATPSVLVRKTFTYRDVPRVWSNRYHFLGGTPVDAAHWHTLMDNITAAEKAALSPANEIIECVGYDAGSDVPVASKTYSLVGTAVSGSNYAPGEACALVRYATDVKTSKNHPVYLFNYYHGVTPFSAAEMDKLNAALSTALGTYANDWISGFSDGSVTYNRAGPNGAAAIGSLVETYMSHRDFRR